MYTIPKEFDQRVHHVRPRFKGQCEDVLFYISREIVRIGKMPTKDFIRNLELSIRRFPGNANVTAKTISNWRTEIDALFGLLVHEGDFSAPSALAKQLSENSDLISFFRVFLSKFQYPGGHLRADKVADLIKVGVKFKPAAYVIRVLLEGAEYSASGNFGITKAEAASLIWNDLRVTTGQRSAKDTAKLIADLRKANAIFNQDGDFIRYAGDILDYMVLANILILNPSGRYSLVKGSMAGAEQVLKAETRWFGKYDHLYADPNVSSQDCVVFEPAWFEYAGNDIQGLIVETDLVDVLEGMESGDPVTSEFAKELLDFLREKISEGTSIKTKEIGDTGESLVMRHEFERLKALGKETLARKIKKIPDKFGIGYDLKSFLDASGVDKLIEVKTTISRGNLRSMSLHLTKNEWNAATSSGPSYFIYRLMISTESIRCFVIHDPVSKYKSNILTMNLNDGADLTFEESAGTWEQLKV
jgi:hypothetical protein